MMRVSAMATIAVLTTSSLFAQTRTSTFTVSVAEAGSGAAVASAEVVLPDLRLLVRTDALGRASLSGIPFGTHRVRVRRLGYAPSEIRLAFARDTTDALFRLERSAVAIAPIDVETDEVPPGLKDFEMRRKQGIGRFLTQLDLQRDADRDFSDAATTRFPGLKSVTGKGGQRLIASRRPCGAGTAGGGNSDAGIGGRAGRLSRGPASVADGGKGGAENPFVSCDKDCLVQVYLDGINLGEDDGALVRTWDLSGVEYYTGASMPARYRTSGSACGVLLLWSRWR